MTSSSGAEGLITIQLEDLGNVRTCFEVHASDSLEAAFAKYAQLLGRLPDSLQFTFGGNIIDPSASPASLGMGDGASVRVDTDGRPETTEEAIAAACTAGSVAAVDLLSANKELRLRSLRWLDADGQELSTPPLYIAIDYGHVELLSLMVPLHEDIIDTLKNQDNYSPLQWASWTGNLEVVQLLVREGGAAVDEESLSLAREHSHQNVAIFLLEHIDLYAGLEDEDEIMEKACREGDVAKVRLLLEGADVKKWQDEKERFLACSPVHLAVRHGHMELIQLFAERGMRVDMDGEAQEGTESEQHTD